MRQKDELISKAAAIDALSKAMPSLTTPDGCGELDHDIYIAQETMVDDMRIINDLPSAQPEIIWCKECANVTKCCGEIAIETRCGGNGYFPLKFCSEGKRKDE